MAVGKALLSDMWQRLKGRLVTLAILAVVAALAESFGLLLLVPILASIGGDAPDWLPAMPSIEILFLVFVAAMLARSALLYLRDVKEAEIIHSYVTGMRRDVARAVVRIGWARANRVGQARLQRYLHTDIPRATIAVGQIRGGIVAVASGIIQAGLAFALSPRLTLVAIVLLALTVGASWYWIRKSKLHGLTLFTKTDESAQSGYALRAGLKAALAEGRSDTFLAHFAKRLRAERDEWVAIDSSHARSRLAGQLGGALALTAILYVGVVVLAIDTPVLILLVILFARLQGPARVLVEALQSVWINAPAFADIAALFAAVPDDGAAAAREGIAPLDWKRLDLQGVVVGIEDMVVERSIDLSIAPGDWIAITGPSGAGKSLLIDTVAGLLRPLAGDIRLDGAPVALDRLAGWPEQLGYIGQHDLLLGESLGDMLRLEGEDDADVRTLLIDVGLGGLIERFGDDLDAPLGEHGATLSGGEKQRIAIARVLRRRPGLLILDEATAALDRESESAIFDLIRSRLPACAVLYISHRSESLQAATKKIILA